MALYATLREYHFESDKDDLRGVSVYDGSQTVCLGTIHDMVIELENGNIAFIMVTTGEREVMLPAERFHLWDENVVVDLSRADFESLPSFDDSMFDEADAWNACQDQFNEAWAKIGKPQPSKPLEIGQAGTEPTLWERFHQTVRPEVLEALRRKAVIAQHRKIYPRRA